jgi:hypothetical protein
MGFYSIESVSAVVETFPAQTTLNQEAIKWLAKST